MSDHSETTMLGAGNLISDSQEERAALKVAEAKMLEVETQFPEWWSMYEDVVPDTAPRAEVVELLQSAPNDFARGVVYGKYLMRLEIAAITKRPWV